MMFLESYNYASSNRSGRFDLSDNSRRGSILTHRSTINIVEEMRWGVCFRGHKLPLKVRLIMLIYYFLLFIN